MLHMTTACLRGEVLTWNTCSHRQTFFFVFNIEMLFTIIIWNQMFKSAAKLKAWVPKIVIQTNKTRQVILFF